jgi:hypothetical protein
VCSSADRPAALAGVATNPEMKYNPKSHHGYFKIGRVKNHPLQQKANQPHDDDDNKKVSEEIRDKVCALRCRNFASCVSKKAHRVTRLAEFEHFGRLFRCFGQFFK